MGLRGPTPTPTEILKRRGSREVAKRDREPRPEKGAPRCPAWLDKEAKAVWRQLVPQLEAIGVLTKIDGNALARYCRLFVRWKQCDAFVRKYGETYTTGYHKDEKTGVSKPTSFQQFPEVGIINKLGPQLLKIEQEFGLTPAARARIQVTPRPAAQTQGKERFFKVCG